MKIFENGGPQIVIKKKNVIFNQETKGVTQSQPGLAIQRCFTTSLRQVVAGMCIVALFWRVNVNQHTTR